MQSKPSFTKLILAKRKFETKTAFAIFKSESWHMDLAYVDKIAKDINGVKYVLVRKDLFDRTVDEKRMKTKDSKETIRAFLNMIKRNGSTQDILRQQENRTC